LLFVICFLEFAPITARGENTLTNYLWGVVLNYSPFGAFLKVLYKFSSVKYDENLITKL